jgi:hypothetical protein
VEFLARGCCVAIPFRDLLRAGVQSSRNNSRKLTLLTTYNVFNAKLFPNVLLAAFRLRPGCSWQKTAPDLVQAPEKCRNSTARAANPEDEKFIMQRQCAGVETTTGSTISQPW